MAKERIFILVKTYPTLSSKHIELVCTAGLREDGSWVRIYPSPFRFLGDEQQYRKFQWVEFDLSKNKNDERPESYVPIDIDNICTFDYLGTGKDRLWTERKKIVLDGQKIFTNKEELIKGAHLNELSLAIFKPAKVVDFLYEPCAANWDQTKEAAAKASLAQGSLFDEREHSDFDLVKKLPYKFSIKFEDDVGVSSTLMIEDWETGQLYWNSRKNHPPEVAAKQVREKYLSIMLDKDVYFFMGTTFKHHRFKAPNPWLVVGLFYPPFSRQLLLL